MPKPLEKNHYQIGLTLFTHKKPSEIVLAGAPSAKEQKLAILEGNNWLVLNTTVLNNADINRDPLLCIRANALKQSLQTFGPTSKRLPSLRQNKGKAQSIVFHGHVTSKPGTIYILEWEILDSDKRIMTLTRFGKHENFNFKQLPYHADEVKAIVDTTLSQKILINTQKTRKNIIAQVDRMTKNQAGSASIR